MENRYITKINLTQHMTFTSEESLLITTARNFITRRTDKFVSTNRFIKTSLVGDFKITRMKIRWSKKTNKPTEIDYSYKIRFGRLQAKIIERKIGEGDISTAAIKKVVISLASRIIEYEKSNAKAPLLKK